MRVPKAPPLLPKLLEETPAKRLAVVVEQSRLTDDEGRYLHFDDMLHRKPPGGLSHEEWWLANKLARAAQARSLPLVSATTAPFSFCETPEMRAQMHALDSETRGQIKSREQLPSRETADFYFVRSLIEEPFSSSVLEGAATTRRIAKEMIEGDRAPRTMGERMVLNNYRAMQSVREMKDRPLTPEAILSLHAILTEGTLDDPAHVGRLRTDRDRVVVEDQTTGEVLHEPPPAAELVERLQQVCDFANGANDDANFIHPIVRAMVLHFMIGFDHPFVDGNGRTARALFYWSALRSGYWLLEFASISKVIREAPTRYGLAYLHAETDRGDLTYFLIYHLEVLAKAVRSLRAYLERKTVELKQLDRLMRARVGPRRQFNERQVHVLQEAIRRPGHHLTIDDQKDRTGVSYLTARADLEGLVKLGLLRKGRSGSRSVYFADGKIVEKLGGG
ncbi:MAG: Fic family protein [Alphaproteobacteria bacterium]|nr:Fic family protein [Alphaproteobacteria bacterium]